MKRMLSLLLVVLLITSLSSGLVYAQVPPDANEAQTSAVVDGTGTPPVINAMWMLPDMQSNVAGIQYGTVGNPHQHDDDMTTAGIQVAPNLGDWPEKRKLEFWVAAEDPNGIGDIIDVFLKVFHPNGSEKYQLHLEKVACSALGNATTVGTPLEAAVHTQQISTATANEILDLCNKNAKAVYRVVGDISKDQPHGQYWWTTWAVDQNGGTGQATAYFDVLPLLGLAIDFGQVNFGNIKPNTKKWVPGDEVWNTAGRPTVMSIGNVWLNLNVHFTNMVGATYQKIINSFDVKLGTTGGFQAPQVVDPIVASTNYLLGNYILLPNCATQIDFSILPGSIPADTYSGEVHLWGTASAAQWDGSLACPVLTPWAPVNNNNG